MMNNNLNQFISMSAPAWVPVVGVGVLVLMLWSIVWKGLGLWHAGRKGHPGWFVAILVLNTAGILEIIYLFAILKLKLNQLFKK